MLLATRDLAYCCLYKAVVCVQAQNQDACFKQLAQHRRSALARRKNPTRAHTSGAHGLAWKRLLSRWLGKELIREAGPMPGPPHRVRSAEVQSGVMIGHRGHVLSPSSDSEARLAAKRYDVGRSEHPVESFTKRAYSE